MKIIYQLLLVLLVNICAWKVIAYNLTLEVDNKMYQYGDDLYLFCQVENCCQELAGWGKWTTNGELITIFIDVKNLKADETSKYHGGTNERGFFFVIRNITRHDLNMAYSCTYGFQVSTKKMLAEPDVFLVQTEVTPVVHSDESKPSKLEVIIPLTLIAVAVCVIVLIILLRYFRLKSDNPNQIERTRTEYGSKADLKFFGDQRANTNGNSKLEIDEESEPFYSDRNSDSDDSNYYVTPREKMV